MVTRPPICAALLCACVLLLVLAATASAFVRPAPGPQRWGLPRTPTEATPKAAATRTRTPMRMVATSEQGQAPPLPGTTLVLEEPKSKTRVYIVGCVHGARASEEDVATVIEGRDAGVVVLELCDSRFQSMRADEEKQRLKEQARAAAAAAARGEEVGAGPQNGVASWAEGVSDFGNSLQEFNKQYGWAQTALVALLSSSAAAQRFLQSGRACEFRKSVELAEAKGAAVVLGDQELSVTLKRFKEGWRAAEDKHGPRAWWPTLAEEMASISDAVFGPKGLPKSQKVEVLPLLFTQGRYLQELLKVMVPVGAIVGLSLQAMQSVGEMTLASLQSVLPTAFLDTTAGGDVVDAAAAGAGAALFGGAVDSNLFTDMGWAAVNVLMVGWFLALNQVILVQRDAFLARSIAQTCRQHPGKRVAAVVGLLHGNGVARHLRGMGFELVDRE